MSIFDCCHDCPDRYPGCSGKCSKYAKAKKDWDARKKFCKPNPDLIHYVKETTSKNRDITMKRKAKGRK